MSAEEIERVIAQDLWFLVEGSPCPLRTQLLAAVRRTFERLDDLPRDHPVWALLAVQTVNLVRLIHFTRWQLREGEADEATDLTEVAVDLARGSVISTEAWSRIALRSPETFLEGVLVQGFFNYHLFSAGTFMNDLKRFLVEHDCVDEALAYLRRPETVDNLNIRWLCPNATEADLLAFAELIDAAAALGSG